MTDASPWLHLLIAVPFVAACILWPMYLVIGVAVACVVMVALGVGAMTGPGTIDDVRALELYADELQVDDLLIDVAPYPVMVAAGARLTLAGELEVMVRRLGTRLAWPVLFDQSERVRVYRR